MRTRRQNRRRHRSLRRVSARITWLGHSTVGIELDGALVVTDPVLRRRIAHLRRDASAMPPPRPDAVLVSHLHYDHLDLPSLARIGRDVRLVVPRGARRHIRRFTKIDEVVPGDTVEVGGVRIDVVNAVHDGRRWPVGRSIPALGFVLRGSRSIYFAGDTELFDGMAALAPLDVALVPVSGWGPKVGPGHLDPRGAAEALTLLRPSIAIPIHWGTYGVVLRGVRGDRTPAEQFAREAASLAPEVDVQILAEGGSLELDT
jgi:L-ascorbate metabolism protein UlaG (beta-lactamase superfamily)